MIKLSIIIVNYNVKYFLEQCLLSVYESKVDFDFEVFVVDNNSNDGSVEYLRPKFSDVNYVENSNNPGFAIANNQAIEACKGKYILLLNPDTVVGENVLANVCSFMDNEQRSGAIGVKMINGYGQFLPESKRGFPTPWASFCKITGLNKLFPNSSVFGKYHLRYLNENMPHEVDVLAGAFMMLRKEAIEKVGNLDEAFFMYGEDIDLSYRIVQGGYKNYYLPEKIIHYKGESTSKDGIKYVKAFYEAMYIFFKKHYPHYGQIYSLLITTGITTRAALAVLRRALGLKNNTGNNRKIILFDHSELAYEDIIEKMDASGKQENNQYHIYSPKSGMTIGMHYAEPKN
ncbi:MAG: glycosyltransferase [Dysgonomonas sp.]